MYRQTRVVEEKAKSSVSLLYLGLVALLLCASFAAIYAHIQIVRTGNDYTGPLGPLDRLFDLLLALGLVATAFCVGRAVARACALSFASVAEEVSFSVMLGTGVIGLAVLALGLLGLLKGLPVVLLIILLIGISYRSIGRLPGIVKLAWSGITASKGRAILALLFVIFAGLLMLRAATPPHAFDEAIYHLSVTKSFVDRGRVYPLVDNSAGNMPFLIQMLYAICLMAKADIAAKLLSLFLGLICSLALYGFCSRFISRRVGVIAAFAFWGAGIVVEVAVTTRIDVTLACMLFVSTYAMILYFDGRQRVWLYVSAVLAGFALGTKHTAILWVFLLGVMFLVESYLKKTAPLMTTLRRGVAYTVITLAVASPWFIKNAVWFHNPIYPFLSSEVVELSEGRIDYFDAADEQKLDAHFEQARKAMPGLVNEREKELARAASNRPIQRPPYIWEYFTNPDVYNFPEDYHYPNYLFLLSPLLLLWPRSRWMVWLAILSVAYYLLARQLFWYSRYFLPIYPPLTIVVAYGLSRLADWLEEKKDPQLQVPLTWGLPAVALGVVLSLAAVWSMTQFSKLHGPGFIAGQLSRRSFMSSMFYYPAIDYINRQLPKDARVMMMGAQMTYDLERDYIADVQLENRTWQRLLVRNDTLMAVHNDLKRQGVTHLLVSYSIFSWAATRSGGGTLSMIETTQPGRPDYYVPLRNWATLDSYTSNFVDQVYSDKMGFVVYKLK